MDLKETGSPRTKKCMKAYKIKQTEESTAEKSKPNKIRRLSNLDVCKFMVTNNIRNTPIFSLKLVNKKSQAKKS